MVKDDVYPINALYNLQFAISKAERNANYAYTSKDFKFESFRRDSADRREIYVLVVGETSRAMEWSLYGYERETTPNLQKENNLICFTDAVTQSNNTHKSVPIILSAASAENYDVLWRQKSIVSAFKEAGFKTLVIANQKLNTSIIWSFYNEADKFIDLSEQVKGFTLQSPYDGEVMPFLKKELESGNENLFIVLHTYGSHFNYHERYPKEFKKFLPDKALGIRAAYKQELRNAYDNSILYTDYVLSQIINELKATDACSSMMYLSDHGEDIYDDSRGRYLHASPIPTCYQLHIPYIIWCSDSYKERFPEKYQTAFANSTMPVSTNSVFHTMLDIANIDTPIKDGSLSLSSVDFRPTDDRKYLGDHDMPISLVKLGLKKQDFEMLDKWKMKYAKE
jgi:glucan phosphoethanolaminetransferase (alkaline phosphatase superfamily)